MSAPGWQQPARPRQCPHMGLVFASLTIGLHDPGHRWVCPCGQAFVVVLDADREKRLVRDPK